MARSTPSNERDAREAVKQLLSFIDAQGQGDYLGEAVSQVQHSLQCATFAQQSQADNETVIAALLHDVGRFIPEAENMPAQIAPDGTYVGNASHEILGEQYLRQLGFSDKICQLVGAHVMAKRYLTAVDKDYYDGLSRSSKMTLEFQGGIFSKQQVLEAQKDPLLQEKLQVRKWDDLAKDPDMQTPPLSSFEDMMVASLLQSRS